MSELHNILKGPELNILERTILNFFLTFNGLHFEIIKKKLYSEDVETKIEKKLILFTKVM